MVSLREVASSNILRNGKSSSTKENIWMPPRDLGLATRKEEDESWMGEVVAEQYQQVAARGISASSDESSKGDVDSLVAQLPGQFLSQLSLSRGPPQQQAVEIGRLRNEMRNMRIGQTMQALEIGRLRRELANSAALQGDQNAENTYLRNELARMRLSMSEKIGEISRLRRELDKSGDSQTELGAEIACLRGELQSALEIQSEQQLEINRQRRELDFLTTTKIEQAAEITRLHNVLDSMNSVDFIQLEDYTIRALQVELKAEARRGIAAPDTALMDAPEDYTGCRQFFQSGFCHFGRGRRPCPNENSHFCLHCGRNHGTAPHLILLRRIGDRSLNSTGPN